MEPCRMSGLATGLKYVLITPARNEEAFIEKTLASMVAQTRLPERWIIVNDGSIDNTAGIVDNYARRFSWIELIRCPNRADRSFSGKVHAFNTGLGHVESLKFDVIGNLDGDVSFDADYLEFLLSKFAAHPRLGVAGTPYQEENAIHDERFKSPDHVSGACQLFRHECFEDIGGYMPINSGGI